MFGSGGRGAGGFAARGQPQSAQFPFGGPAQGGGAPSNPFQPSAAAAPVFGAPSPGFGARLTSAPRSTGNPSGFGAPAPSSVPSGPAFGTRSAAKTTFGGASTGGSGHTTFGTARSEGDAFGSGGGAHTAFGSRAQAPFGGTADPPHAPPQARNPFADSGASAGGRGGRGAKTRGRGASPGGRGAAPFGGRGAASFGGDRASFSGGKSSQSITAFGDSATLPPTVHTTFGSGASGGPQRRGSRSRPGTHLTSSPSFGGTAGGGNPFQPSQPSASGPLSGPLPPDVGGARQPPGLQPRTTFGGARPSQAQRIEQATARVGRGKTLDGAHDSDANPFQAGGSTHVAFGEQSAKRKQGHRQPLNQEQIPNGQPKRNALGGVANAGFAGAQHNHGRPSGSPPLAPSMSPSSFPAAAPTTALEKSELAAATNLDGLCIDMCSLAERELHIRVDELSVFEKCYPDQPGTERDLIIKRFQRSSADHKLDIPEEIRPPGVLRRTQLYIEEHIMDLERDGEDPRFSTPRAPELIELYNFCWDRFRMIRKDFVLQNYRGAGGRVHPIVLDVHERIARYHVLSEHELCEVTSFVAQQNMEQLGQTLKSLNELYDESRKHGDPRRLSPFEAECRAYFILCTLDNGRGLDVLKFVKGLPPSIMESPHVKFAMRVFVARHTGDYHMFFSLLKQATYLQACLLFRYMISMRSQALQRMNRGYRTQSYALADLAELLCFEDEEHAAAVCQQHGLKLKKKADAQRGEYVVVRFGGEFESDTQLRKNKTPLAVRASWRFIGIKKGNFLRRDVCRGVTEYDEYPALSSLIQAFEDDERARLYPTRPRYVDNYSYFVDFATAPPPGLAEQPHEAASAWQSRAPVVNGDCEDDSLGMEPEADECETVPELEAIALRKAQLLRKQQEAMERIRELQRAKEERQRLEREKKEQAEQREAEAREKQEAVARQKAEEEAESRRQQEELAQRVREAEQQQRLRQQQQKEEDERRRREEEAARVKREQEAEEQRRLEAMRAKAAEEERRRQEALRVEEARRREEAERARQRELAEEAARRKREAELEAKRQAQLARELAEKKRLRRIQKQKLAVLQLRFSQWKAYVRASRHPVRPATVRLPSVYETAASSRHGAKEKLEWLLARGTARSTPAGLISQKKKRGQDVARHSSDGERGEPAPLPPVDVAGVVGPALQSRHPAAPLVPWKLLIADLQSDEPAPASFGQWCAARVGIPAFSGSASSADGSSDMHLVFQPCKEASGVLACCRYVDHHCLAGATDSSRLLTAVSALLVPVELTWLQGAGSYQRWDCALEQLVAALPSTGRTVLVVLAGANAGIRKTAVAPLLEAIERTARRVQTSYASRVTSVSFHLMVNEDGDASAQLSASMSRRLEQVLADAAASSPLQPQLVEVELKEVLDGALRCLQPREADAARPRSGDELQAQVGAAMAQIHKEVFSSDAMQRDFPPPELERVLPEPPVGWNGPESKARVADALRTLASERVDCAALDQRARTLAPDQVCDLYFKAAVEFVDRLFRSGGRAEAEVSLFELKKRLFAALLPVHERLTSSQAADVDGSRLVPWRDMLALVYGAYVEALGDVAIYAAADAALRRRVLYSSGVSSGAAVAGGKRTEASPAPHPVVVSVKHLKGALGGRVPSIAVSLPARARTPKTQAKSRAQSSSRRASRELHKLRAALDREKAATSQFQRMLRQEVQRWSTDGALP